MELLTLFIELIKKNRKKKNIKKIENMKTIEIQIFKFDELSEGSKNVAIENFRNDNLDHDFIYDDAHKSVEAFNAAFGTKEGSRSWLDVSTRHIEDAILELNGFRLQKYLTNNFGVTFLKNKYLKHGQLSDTKKPFHRMMKQREITNNCPNKGKFSISYYSNLKKESSCNLTGVCYDDDLLQPIYEFLQKRDFSNCTIDFKSLLNDCFQSLKKSIENEVDYRNTDESIIEEIKANDYDFTENGKIY